MVRRKLTRSVADKYGRTIRNKPTRWVGCNTFWVSRVSPGNSTAFSVYVENVSVENSSRAMITYENGMVRYYQ